MVPWVNTLRRSARLAAAAAKESQKNGGYSQNREAGAHGVGQGSGAVSYSIRFGRLDKADCYRAGSASHEVEQRNAYKTKYVRLV